MPGSHATTSRAAAMSEKSWRAPGPDNVEVVRDLAGRGTLARRVASASPVQRRTLVGGVYEIAWPVVFNRVTRLVELRRGHVPCSRSVSNLADECLDRFHDDVEAAVDYVLRNAHQPILNMEAWLASRLRAATVDGHRRRRGLVGALQRPRVPAWLANNLGQDRWLVSLATQILIWVGVTSTAGAGLWPLDSWAHRRGMTTGDWPGSDQATVQREVEIVLDAMRHRYQWYLDYVERPLGHKRAPVVTLLTEDARNAEPPALSSTEEHELDNEHLVNLAADAIAAIEVRLRRGEDARAAVVDVIRTVFCSDPGTPAWRCASYAAAGADEAVLVVLDDPQRAARVVDTVLAIIGHGRVTEH